MVPPVAGAGLRRRRTPTGGLLPVGRVLARVGGAAVGAAAHGVPVALRRPPGRHDAGGRGPRWRGRAPTALSSKPRTPGPSPTPARPVGPTRSARWPRRPASTTPSAGGRTPSSTATTGSTALRRACARPWPRCARDGTVPTGHRRGPTTGGARRPCAGSSAPPPVSHERVAVVCGAWHAPALAPTPSRRQAPTPPCSGPAQGQGGGHLGAVDQPAGWPGAPATAPASPRPAGTTTCSRAPRTTCVARWLVRAAALLRDERARRVRRRRSSRPCAWPRRWPPCGAARSPAWPS